MTSRWKKRESEKTGLCKSSKSFFSEPSISSRNCGCWGNLRKLLENGWKSLLIVSNPKCDRLAVSWVPFSQVPRPTLESHSWQAGNLTGSPPHFQHQVGWWNWLAGNLTRRYRWTKVGQHLLTYGEFEKTYGRGDEVTVTQSRDFLWAAIMMMRLNHWCL